MNAIGRIILIDHFDNVFMKNQNFGRCIKSNLREKKQFLKRILDLWTFLNVKIPFYV